METNEINSVSISLETIEDFLHNFKEKNRREATVLKYSADLKAFYHFLPGEDKMLCSKSLPAWRDYLISRNLAVRTINTRISSCNTFLEYLDRKIWQISPLSLKGQDNTPEISRDEYYALLKKAHESNNEWLYFLIKSFCCLGLSVSELPCLTIDALVAGKIDVATKSRRRSIYIPEVLRSEFLFFANRSNINSGALFKSPLGEPLTRKYISKELHALCKAAGIPESKGNPKSLRNLYANTYSDIRSTSSSLINKEYSKILEEEDSLVGWDTLAV